MRTAVGRYYEVLDEAIAAAGGVRPLDQGEGETVVATFVQPSAAVAAALAGGRALQRELDWLPVRIALHTSEARLRGAGRYVGGAVTEGERLRSLGHGGQVLVCEQTAAAASDDLPPGATLLEVGTTSRRDRGRPERVFQLVHRDLVADFPPLRSVAPHNLPTPLAVRPGVGVVGRKPELDRIATAIDRAATGAGREVLLISGEAGMGKTTLVAEAARAAFDEGACVLFGHCEDDLATPYQLFAEALGHLVAHATDEQLRSHVEVHGSELVRIVPGLASRLDDLPALRVTDGETERYLAFASVVGLLQAVSEHQCVVLVFDDLQWADSGSLQLLAHLTAAEHQMRLAVLGTYRDNEVSTGHPLVAALAAMHRQVRVDRLELGGLGQSGVVAYLEAAAGHPLDASEVGLAESVFHETDGNPFFVGEVLRHLAERGAIRPDGDGRWSVVRDVDEVGLPDSVREVIGARVGRLGTEAGRMLALAAVIGRDFDLELLSRASSSDADGDEVLELLDAAGRVAVVRERPGGPGRFHFAHALIQRTIYDDLGPTRQARAHRRIGEALEALVGGDPGGRVGELARHFARSDRAGDAAKALEYSRRAGEAALEALAPDGRASVLRTGDRPR